MALENGERLDAKYEIVKRLASGGMGDLYLARHLHLDELRVVKILRSDLDPASPAAQRFQQEARIATQVKHPNVAILHDFSRLEDGRYYMVWEHIEGEDLGVRLESEGRLAPPVAIEIAIQALRGLDAIHSAGVVHRDISPDNLMLARDRRGRSQVKIIDLGLVKDLRDTSALELTEAGSFLGKLRYCSPEQAEAGGEPLDPRSDLYSLAQVLYEMLAGEAPFESQSPHGYVLKRLTEEPIPLSRRVPGLTLPPALEPVVMRGLARQREDRYPDAGSFIAALGELLRVVGPADDVRAAPAPAATTPPPRRAAVEMTREEKRELLGLIERSGGARPTGATSAGAARRAMPAAPAPAPSPAPGAAAPPKASLPPAAEPPGAPPPAAPQPRKPAVAPDVVPLLATAEEALAAERLDEAQAALAEARARQPTARGLAALEARLREARELTTHRERVRQAEQLVERFVAQRNERGARLALEALVDLYPNHPRRSDFEAWVGLMADEEAQQRALEREVAEARAALAREDVKAARAHLANAERFDMSGDTAAALAIEIDRAERGALRGREAEALRERLESHLERGEVAAAQQQLDALAALEVTKVTLDLYRSRVEEERLRHEAGSRVAAAERRFRSALDRGDWLAAREAAREVGEVLPDDPRGRQMAQEVSRRETLAQKERSLADGLRMFDDCLARGDRAQASLALKVLRQLGGDDPRVARAAKKLGD